MSVIINMLLIAPKSQLDKSMVNLIKKWDSPPKALQILEVLDKSIRGNLASRFVVTTLECELDMALLMESVTKEDVVKQATWRKEA